MRLLSSSRYSLLPIPIKIYLHLMELLQRQIPLHILHKLPIFLQVKLVEEWIFVTRHTLTIVSVIVEFVELVERFERFVDEGETVLELGL